MLRALAQCISSEERFATLETEYELLLHTIPGRFRLLMPVEERVGGGDRDASGKPAGEITMGDVFPWTLRHSLERVIVGEARNQEIVYLPEEGITLDDLTSDVRKLAEGFRSGKRLGLVIRSENADPVYSTGFITSLVEKEGNELFDARQAILGHVQEGGDPSPFDRIEATRLTAACISNIAEQLETGGRASAMIGFQSGRLLFTDLTSYPTLIEETVQRPKEQRWMESMPLAEIMTR
jgi:Phosphofructokinase